MNNNKHHIITLLAALTLLGCQEADLETDTATEPAKTILVGGIDADLLTISKETTTRASQNAELVPWLIKPLKDGIDVSYYLRSNPDKGTLTAVLRLIDKAEEANTDSTLYTFNYKVNGAETNAPAQWLGNAGHVFHGFHIPEGIDNIDISNQSTTGAAEGDVTDYDRLVRYLSMPPNHEIMATVGYVRLPFRHRLSRVLAYVLVDPGLQSSIKGDIISFENVKVLKTVHGTTPEWTEARKIVPHTLGTFGSVDRNMNEIHENFLVFRHKTTETYIYPTEDEWKAAKADYDNLGAASEYEMTDYGKVPCFDAIVRPTYTSSALVMYDEDMTNGMTAAKYAAEKNSIDFVVDLNNGLSYHKHFEFDLDANYQTAVFLRISREQVDYQTMGSEKWHNSDANDGYYGVDNELDHRLSIAGGCWQRAYRIRENNPNVTDGSKYEEQYISEDKWKEYFFSAVKPGYIMPLEGTEPLNHWGDYFVLDKDITINVNEFPADFVFTGHLDGRGHTITLTGGTTETSYLFDGLDGDYEAEAGQANCHAERDTTGQSTIVPLKGYRAEVLNMNVSGGTMFKSGNVKKTGHIYNCTDINGKVTK